MQQTCAFAAIACRRQTRAFATMACSRQTRPFQERGVHELTKCARLFQQRRIASRLHHTAGDPQARVATHRDEHSRAQLGSPPAVCPPHPLIALLTQSTCPCPLQAHTLEDTFRAPAWSVSICGPAFLPHAGPTARNMPPSTHLLDLQLVRVALPSQLLFHAKLQIVHRRRHLDKLGVLQLQALLVQALQLLRRRHVRCLELPHDALLRRLNATAQALGVRPRIGQRRRQPCVLVLQLGHHIPEGLRLTEHLWHKM
eukprot:364363-Chlamydomonas_euryale.AAC.4